MNTPRPVRPTRLSRRRLLAGAGGAVAAGALAGNRASAWMPFRSSGDLPTLSQWYHEYGEEGVLEAVERYAADYAGANVEVEWIPGDWATAFSAALLTDEGPDIFEYGNGPTIDMILAGQVVPLDDVLGDAEDDFNERMLQRLSFDGHLWAVPQVIDMQFLIYRKSMLEDAGVEPPTTLDELIAAAEALTTGAVKGLFLGNDGGAGILGGPLMWSAGANYLTDDHEFGFDTEAVHASFAKAHELFESDSLLLGAPTEWHSPGAFVNGLTAMQLTGLWTIPEITEALEDDFDVIPWPAFDSSEGGPSVPIGAFSSCISSRTADVDAAKDFVKWLWVDGVEMQTDFALSYGFHLPSRNSLAAEADALQSGPAANAVRLSQENGFTQNPMLWPPEADTAYSDARVRMIQEGADPAEQIAGVREIAERELERILGSVSDPEGSEPATTG